MALASKAEVRGLQPRDHEAAGALFTRVRESEMPRHYGDPTEEYDAAIRSVAVRDRSHRSRLLVRGSAPVETLTGVFTGQMPSALEPLDGAGMKGVAQYSAVLTAKGKMVADLRIMRGPESEDDSLFLDIPGSATKSLVKHLGRCVPPRLATIDNVSNETGLLAVLGPEGAPAISEFVRDRHVSIDSLMGLGEGEFLVSGTGVDQVRVVKTLEVNTPAWDLFVSDKQATVLWRKLIHHGAKPIGVSVWDVLRVEAGRPAYGQDMDDSTILSETGIVDRAVDHNKGCYTGQEVIVRIRDRGHVNRSLRGLLLADGPIPKSNAELFYDGRAAGHITSVVESPRSGGGIALGYVRKEVLMGERVAVASPDGPTAEVRNLSSNWALS